jgi:hypothetical protein
MYRPANGTGHEQRACYILLQGTLTAVSCHLKFHKALPEILNVKSG